MLTRVRLADRWREIQRELPDGWADARLELTVADDARAEEVASLLGSLMPGRRGSLQRLRCSARRDRILPRHHLPGALPHILRPNADIAQGPGEGGVDIVDTHVRLRV